MEHGDELVTTAQAAKILGVSIKSVLRFADRGDLPVAVRVPGLTGPRMYLVNDVHALAQKRASA